MALSLGGGIFNEGMVTVSYSTYSGNSAEACGGGIWNYSDGTLAVSDSTFSGNSAVSGGGICNAGMFVGGTVTVSNSTIADNSATDRGGGIYNDHTLTVRNSTLSGNRAFSGGGIHNQNSGATTSTLQNTIVASSPSGNNCAGAITDGGGNLSYPDITCPGADGDPSSVPCRTMAARPIRWRLAQAVPGLTRRTTRSVRRPRSTTSTSAASPVPRAYIVTSAL